jgi:predicted NodU family carbamoyl transferase
MKTALALTLGHNSSAVLIQDGEIIAGYEQERFSAKKSDSAFPKDAIKELALRHLRFLNLIAFLLLLLILAIATLTHRLCHQRQ